MTKSGIVLWDLKEELGNRNNISMEKAIEIDPKMGITFKKENLF